MLLKIVCTPRTELCKSVIAYPPNSHAISYQRSIPLRLQNKNFISRSENYNIINGHIHIEISELLFTTLESSNMSVNSILSYVHHSDTARKSIQIFNTYYTSIVRGIDTKALVNIWDKLLPKAESILNLLRKSRVNPDLSSYY